MGAHTFSIVTTIFFYLSITFILSCSITANATSCTLPTIASNQEYTIDGCTQNYMITTPASDITNVIINIRNLGSSVSSLTIPDGGTLRNSIYRVSGSRVGAAYIKPTGKAINVTYEFFDLSGTPTSSYLGIQGSTTNCTYRFLGVGFDMDYQVVRQSQSTDDIYYYEPKAATPISISFLTAAAYVRPTVIIAKPTGGVFALSLPSALNGAQLILQDGFIASLAMTSINAGCLFVMRNIIFSSTATIGQASGTSTTCTQLNPCLIQVINVTNSSPTVVSALTITGSFSSGTTLKIMNCVLKASSSAIVLSGGFYGNTTVEIRFSTLVGLAIDADVIASTTLPHYLIVRDCAISQTVISNVRFINTVRAGAYILFQRNLINQLGTFPCLAFDDNALSATCAASFLDNAFTTNGGSNINLAVMQYDSFEMWNNTFDKSVSIDFAEPSGPEGIGMLLINNTIKVSLFIGSNAKPEYSLRRVAACNIIGLGLPASNAMAWTPCHKSKRVSRCKLFSTFPSQSPRVTQVDRAAVEPCIEGGLSALPITASITTTLVPHTYTETRSRLLSASNTVSGGSRSHRATQSHSVKATDSHSVLSSPTASKSTSLSKTITRSESAVITPTYVSEEPPRTETAMPTYSGTQFYTLTHSTSLSPSKANTQSEPTILVTDTSSVSATRFQTFSANLVNSDTLPPSTSLTASQTTSDTVSRNVPNTTSILQTNSRSSSFTTMATSTQTLIEKAKPSPVYTPTPEVKAVTDTASVIAIVGAGVTMSGAQLTTSMALLRMLRCGQSAEVETESLPVLVHPMRFSIPFPGDDDGLGEERGAIIGNCLLVPIAAAALIYWPISFAVGALTGTDLAAARMMLAWPSVSITPWVVLAEGIAECVVSLLASGSAGNIAFAFIGTIAMFGLVGLWGWCLWRLPLGRLGLSAAPMVSGIQWWLSARKEWTLGRNRRRAVLDDDLSDEESVSGTSTVEGLMILYASFLSEKWLLWADLASLILSVAVGVMEGIEPTSTQVCLSRAVVAVVFAVLQVGLGLLTLIPVDMAFNVAQATLTIVLSAIIIAAVEGDDLGLSGALDGISFVIGILGIAGSLVGFIQAHSKSQAIHRRQMRLQQATATSHEKVLLTPTDMIVSDLSIFEEFSKKASDTSSNRAYHEPKRTEEMEESPRKRIKPTFIHTDDANGRSGRFRMGDSVRGKGLDYAQWHEAALVEADLASIQEEQRRSARFSCSSFAQQTSENF